MVDSPRLVAGGQSWARVAGVLWASLIAVGQMAFLNVYPIWSLIIITMSLPDRTTSFKASRRPVAGQLTVTQLIELTSVIWPTRAV